MSVAVIGGGIAGLAAAHRLASRGIAATVFESTPRLGGKLEQAEIDGVRFDVGAESVLARRPEALDLIRQLGLGADLVDPEPVPALLWSRSELRPLPSSVMGIPADIEAALRTGALSADPLIRPLATPTDDVSIREFVASRVGAEIADRLVDPILGGVYAGNIEELSLFSAAPVLAELGEDLIAGASARRARTIDAAPMVAGINGGIGILPGQLAAGLSTEPRLEAVVRGLQKTATGWTVIASRADKIQRENFDAVIVAVPGPAAARLLAEAAPVAAYHLADLSYVSVAVVSLLVAEAELPDATGFLIPSGESTRIKAATFASQKWQWLADRAAGRQIIRASLGRAGDLATLQLDDATLTELAIDDLTAIIGPTGSIGSVVGSHVQRWPASLPQYTVGHAERQGAIESQVAQIDGLEVCGAAYRGLGIAAVVASANRAADRIVARETITT